MKNTLLFLTIFLSLFFADVSANDIVRILGDYDSTWQTVDVNDLDVWRGATFRQPSKHQVHRGQTVNEIVRFFGRAYAPRAADYDSTPTVLGGGGRMAHLGVIYDPEPWNGWHGWLCGTPMPAAWEDATILVSNDLRTWDSPRDDDSAVVVDSTQINDGGTLWHNSDSDITFGNDDSLWVIWRAAGTYVTLVSGAGGSRYPVPIGTRIPWEDLAPEDTMKIHIQHKIGHTAPVGGAGGAMLATIYAEELFCSKSVDGENWIARQKVDPCSSGNAEGYSSPCFIWWNDTCRVYYIDADAVENELHYRPVLNNNLRTLGDSVHCHIDEIFDGSRDWWHVEMDVLNGVIYGVLTTSTALAENYFIYSTDGDTFEVQDEPIRKLGTTGEWDDNLNYRGSFLPLWRDGKFRLAEWYIGQDGSQWHMGYSEMYFGVEDGILADFEWAVNEPSDTFTVWHPVWEYPYDWTMKVENTSIGQNDISDTVVFSATVPFDPLEKTFDSSYAAIESLVFFYKTSTAFTPDATVKFRFFKRESVGGDTVSLYALPSGQASATWARWHVAGSAIGDISPGDDFLVWMITTADFGDWVQFTKPRVYYLRESSRKGDTFPYF